MKRAALLVGINQYQDPGVQRLACAVKDAVALEHLLQKDCGFEVRSLVNEQATKRAIVDAWEALCLRLSPGDAILFYFAGHGHDLRDGGHGLMPYEAHLKDIDYGLDSDMIRVQALEAISRKSGASRFLLYDACRTVLRANTRDGRPRLEASGARNMIGFVGEECRSQPPIATLWACSQEERAYEIPRLGRSVFSLAFEHLLTTHVRSRSELAWPGHVLTLVSEHTTKLLKEHGITAAQNPMLVSNRSRLVLLEGSPEEPNTPLDVESPPGFRFIRRLGQGALGTTWLAEEDASAGQPAPARVVLKFLDKSRFLSFADQLLSVEIPKSQRLRHPHIVQVHSWHHSAGEHLFSAAEFVPGKNVREALRQHPAGRFSSVELEPLLEQLLSALAFAHDEVGIPHGNIKPTNLLLDSEGRLKLGDFKLPLPWSGERREEDLAFASPQQISGQEVTIADDIYSVGAVLYYLMTGESPALSHASAHGESPVATMDPRARLSSSPDASASRSIDAAAAETVRRCLSDDPLARPRDVRELAHWWRYGPPEWIQKPVKQPVRWRVWVAAGIAVLGLAFGTYYKIPKPPPQPPENFGAPSNAWPFRTTDLVQPESFARKLKEPHDALSRYLAEQLSSSTRNLLLSWQSTEPTPVNLSIALVEELNRIVTRSNLWEGARFSNVVIRPEAQLLLSSGLTNDSLFRFNRLILENAYPEELTSNPPPPPSAARTALLLKNSHASSRDLSYSIYLPSRLGQDSSSRTELAGGTVLSAKDQLVPVSITQPFLGSMILEFGTGTQRNWKDWSRIEVPLRIGTTQEVLLRPVTRALDLAASQPVELELFDGWGNRVCVIQPDDFFFRKAEGYALQPWRLKQIRGFGYRDLKVGSYSITLSDKVGSKLRLEAFNKPFTLSPGTNDPVIELPLEPWNHPRWGAGWTNGLRQEFVPIPGQRFLAGVHEVSVADFELFARSKSKPLVAMETITVKGSVNEGRTWREMVDAGTTNLPIVGVSWSEAKEFCDWLTQVEQAAGRLLPNQRYALPSDRQWSELAGDSDYPWGSRFPPRLNEGFYTWRATTETNWPPEWKGLSFQPYSEKGTYRSAPISSGPTNQFGLRNVGGNVAEWCDTEFDESIRSKMRWEIPAQRHLDAVKDGGYQVVRGASWFDQDQDMLRTDARWAERPETRNDRIGFRLILTEKP